MLYAKYLLPCVLAASIAFGAEKIPWPSGLPKYDHVVIVIEENKDYGQVMGEKKAPYLNEVLAKEGAILTQIYGEEHHSQGNYFWLFSGSNHNIGFKDQVPKKKITAPNLGERLLAHGLTFAGFSENLPANDPEISITFD